MIHVVSRLVVNTVVHVQGFVDVSIAQIVLIVSIVFLARSVRIVMIVMIARIVLGARVLAL